MSVVEKLALSSPLYHLTLGTNAVSRLLRSMVYCNYGDGSAKLGNGQTYKGMIYSVMELGNTTRACVAAWQWIRTTRPGHSWSLLPLHKTGILTTLHTPPSHTCSVNCIMDMFVNTFGLKLHSAPVDSIRNDCAENIMWWIFLARLM